MVLWETGRFCEDPGGLAQEQEDQDYDPFYSSFEVAGASSGSPQAESAPIKGPSAGSN